jgi:hypothetical protein
MTKEESEVSWLRAAFAQPDGAPNPELCPPPERLWAAAAGELGPAEVRAVVEHLGACADCAEEWRLAVELEAGKERVSRAPDAIAPARWKTWLPIAAALTAVGLGLTVHQLREPPERSHFRGENEEIQPAIADGSTLERGHFVLRWTPAPAARTYTVVVQDATFRERFRAEGLTVPKAEVPASAFAGLGASDRVYWQVTTSFSDGTKATSKAWSILLR